MVFFHPISAASETTKEHGVIEGEGSIIEGEGSIQLSVSLFLLNRPQSWFCLNAK